MFFVIEVLKWSLRISQLLLKDFFGKKKNSRINLNNFKFVLKCVSFSFLSSYFLDRL